MTEQEARQRVIASMCPDRVCRTCGEPSRRMVDVSYTSLENPELNRAEPSAGSRGRPMDRLALREQNSQGMANGRAAKHVTTLGFTDCGHDDWRPGVVLDPFQTEEGVMLTLGNIDE